MRDEIDEIKEIAKAIDNRIRTIIDEEFRPFALNHEIRTALDQYLFENGYAVGIHNGQALILKMPEGITITREDGKAFHPPVEAYRHVFNLLTQNAQK